MTTKELITTAVAAVTALGGGAYYEYKTLEEVENEVESLKIQVCLLINEVNRQSGNTDLQRCGL